MFLGILCCRRSILSSPHLVLYTFTALQSREVDGCNLLAELLALDGGKFELERSGLAGAVSAGEGSCAPWGATVDFGEVGELWEGVLVAEGDIDDCEASS